MVKERNPRKEVKYLGDGSKIASVVIAYSAFKQELRNSAAF